MSEKTKYEKVVELLQGKLDVGGACHGSDIQYVLEVLKGVPDPEKPKAEKPKADKKAGK